MLLRCSVFFSQIVDYFFEYFEYSSEFFLQIVAFDASVFPTAFTVIWILWSSSASSTVLVFLICSSCHYSFCCSFIKIITQNFHRVFPYTFFFANIEIYNHQTLFCKITKLEYVSVTLEKDVIVRPCVKIIHSNNKHSK